MTSPRIGKVAIVYGAQAGVGGLGLEVANAIADWADVANQVVAIGPGRASWVPTPSHVEWIETSPSISNFRRRWTWLRWLTGRLQLLADQATGRQAAAVLPRVQPDLLHAFTQVGLESLRWAKAARVATLLESPNGHIRNFREVYLREYMRMGSRYYLGHPNPQMVDRVEEEYTLANMIRVSSDWATGTFTARGVPINKVRAIRQRTTAQEILPPTERRDTTGPLRVCFVGTLDLRKGFVYLLRAVRRFGVDRCKVRLVGGTVDSLTRRVLARESSGLAVDAQPGHPLKALHWAELFVLPTLEDGFGFVVIEAMAAGLPVVVTDSCGCAALIRPHETGWVIPAGDEEALFQALTDAWSRRNDLGQMGDLARADWEMLAKQSNTDALRLLYAESH